MLVPESAHGTNPATAALLGYRVEAVPARADGTVDPEEVQERLGPDVAAIMLTNPNTCGLFERDVVAIAEAVHAAGAYFYCDGANFNAIVGKVRPGDLGVDAMHINLHKTFSTPHGGGGPGAGPVVLSAALAPFAPLPLRRRDGDGRAMASRRGHGRCEARRHAQPFGRMCAFHGQMGMFVRALAYMLSHGVGRHAAGVRGRRAQRQLHPRRARRPDVASRSATGPACTRRCSTTAGSKGTGVTTLDFAKAMIDEGFHPMTVYFPLVVHGAMLIEPTEVGVQGEPRPVHRRAARPGRRRQGRRRRRASRTRRASPRAAASTRPRPHASRGSDGRRPWSARRRRSDGVRPLAHASAMIRDVGQGV